MSLSFRNIDVSPEDPVEVWPTEAVLTALERGGLGHWRQRAECAAVAAEITRLQAASGMARAEFASAIGTSVSRLSTYLSGKVTPSAALLIRMRRVATRSSSAAHPST